jgi:dethiobiotin synthetase
MRLVVTGTDTGIGKTVFAAALCEALGASYWKPVQAGDLHNTDSMTVARLSDLPQSRILAEAYRLTTPCSPHESSALDGVRIDPNQLRPPDEDPLVIEGAGGLMVPLSDEKSLIDIFTEWNLPVVLVARTSLGTINHSLLSIEALRTRRIPILGVAFVGPPNEPSELAICQFGKVVRLGRLPVLDCVDRESLVAAFEANFDLRQFQ